MRGSERGRAVAGFWAVLLAAAGAALAAAFGGSAVPGQAAESKTFTPIADTYVRADASSDFGTSDELRVDADPATVTFIRFDLTGSGRVTNAKLRLFSLNDSTGVSVNLAGTRSWSEGDFSYTDAPAVGEPIAKTEQLGEAEWTTVDVTSAVQGDEPVTLALTTTSPTTRRFGSRESDTSPTLLTTVESASTGSTTTAPSTTGPPATTTDPASSTGGQPTFPIRAAFYYPWFPEAWNQQGINPYTQYAPTLGSYRTTDQATIQNHIRSLEYGNIDAAISSWWGQGTKEDARFPQLLSETDGLGSPLRWAPYYEEESLGDPTAAKIADDLAYIKSRYASDSAYLRVGGRPVIFVFSTGSDGCGMADRWKTANAGLDFYVVLKVFTGYRNCASQPASWHQYGPAKAADRQDGYSYSVSPGFYKAGESSPRLARDLARFDQNVSDMVASGEPWQLVTTFNEWGEGTAVESAAEWGSASGDGKYLDVLHNHGKGGSGVPSPPTTSPTPSPSPSPSPSPTPSSGDALAAAAGDISCTQGGDGTGSCRDKATSDLIAANLPDRVLTLGDQQYDTGTLSAFQSYYDSTWGRFRDRTSPAPGNHDPYSSGYSTYFGARAPARHYAFNLGSWRLYSLDSNNPDTAEVNWLKSDLAANPRDCVLAYWHHARFSSGSNHGNDIRVRPLWQALYDAGADVVLSGHEHNYERFAPQDADGAPDAARGLREFVVGTGGKNLYPIGSPKPNSEARNSSTYGVLELTLQAGGYQWKFRPVAGGSFADTGSDSCH
jgi:hypothetical protein